MGAERFDKGEVRADLGRLGPLAFVERLGLADGHQREGRDRVRILHHGERTPSCLVRLYPDGLLGWTCFGCGAKGDDLDLIAETEGTDFAGALRMGAEIAGTLPTEPGAPRRLRPLPPPAPPRRPPGVMELWNRCAEVWDLPEIAERLRARVMDPAVITDRVLARVLPVDELPGWARRQGQTWAESGHTLVLLMYGASGAAESIHARTLAPGADPKGLSPAGFQIAGLVMANAEGQALLAGPPDYWLRARKEVKAWEADVVIVEGATDFLTASAKCGDNEGAPAVLGVIAGSWSAEISARIPAELRVSVMTDRDKAGFKYARDILDTLHDRCNVRTWPEALTVGNDE